MNRLISILIISSCLGAIPSAGQAPFTTMDSVDINSITTRVMVHGDMWWNPVTGSSECAYPSGSGKNISSAAGFWISGYDAGNSLHVSAQTYRQTGNDYWPGPLDGSDTLTYATSQNWAKIWKVTSKEIQVFQALSATGSATPSNTAAAIWEWPATGNMGAKGNGGVALTITDSMAPFVDINGNGIYEPQLGEYPDVPGDEALWWVFSDNGPAHSQTNGKPLGVEVHAMAFAFQRWNILDEIVYYNFTVVNKSANNYQNVRAGLYADMELGQKDNDFIGCDTARGMGIIYNGTPTDSVYGSSMPMAGVIISCGTNFGFGNFMYISNNLSGTGNPTSPAEYDNYVRSKFKDGTHAVDDYTVPGTITTGHGAGPQTNFVFNGRPGNTSEWSECSSGNTPGGRRMLISTGDGSLGAGASTGVTVILVASNPAANNACGDAGLDFSGIDSVADAAVAVCDDRYRLPVVPAGVANAPRIDPVRIYPNPVNNILYLVNGGNNATEQDVAIRNVFGQAMDVPTAKSGQQLEMDISRLAAGFYIVVYRSNNMEEVMKFVKE